MLNLVTMGVSLDVSPSSNFWVILEVVYASIFVFEIVFKICKKGVKDYAYGEERKWNLLDLGITGMSVTEVFISVVVSFQPKEEGDSDGVRITAILRVLRATRVIRLVKLLRFKMMRELASMLVGIVIGIPALIWVFFLFLLVVFVMGTSFRVVLGPNEGQDLIGDCGLPDDFIHDPLFPRPECKIHYMYGEEFFGTVKKAMFTTFRLMIGDFTTYNGKNLAVALSRGYGDMFHITYGIGMIAVMFGLFNVITAIFVDSTVSGLKHTDLKKNHSRANERTFVKSKLKALLEQIVLLRCQQAEDQDELGGLGAVREEEDTKRKFSFLKKGRKTWRVGAHSFEGLQMDEEEFFQVINDEGVQRIS